MSNVGEQKELGEKETTRLEAFSDGVFGIAMTLLVLELKVPTFAQLGGTAPTAASLLFFLGHQWPGYFAFVSSFFTILVMWVHHHALFRLIHRVDPLLLFANGLLLLIVTAVPFPTAVLAQYLMTPAASAACGLYSAYYVLVALVFFVLLRTAFRPHMLSPTAKETDLNRFRRSYWVGPPAYSAAAVASIYSVWLSLGICTGLWVYWMFATIDSPHRWDRSDA